MSDMTTENLAPCPFCGGEAHHTTYKHPYMMGDTERHNIECMDCGAEAGYGDSTGGLSWTTKEAAYKQWNTRAEPEQVTHLQKENAELRDFLKMVADADSASNEAKAIMGHTFIYNAKRLLNQVEGD